MKDNYYPSIHPSVRSVHGANAYFIKSAAKPSNDETNIQSQTIIINTLHLFESKNTEWAKRMHYNPVQKSILGFGLSFDSMFGT